MRYLTGMEALTFCVAPPRAERRESGISFCVQSDRTAPTPEEARLEARRVTVIGTLSKLYRYATEYRPIRRITSAAQIHHEACCGACGVELSVLLPYDPTLRNPCPAPPVRDVADGLDHAA